MHRSVSMPKIKSKTWSKVHSCSRLPRGVFLWVQTTLPHSDCQPCTHPPLPSYATDSDLQSSLATNSIFFESINQKSLICQINEPLLGKYFFPFCSSKQLLRLRLSLQLTLLVASGTTDNQGHLQVWLGSCRGPRTHSKIVNSNLDCAFVENALFIYNLWLRKVNRIELS